MQFSAKSVAGPHKCLEMPTTGRKTVGVSSVEEEVDSAAVIARKDGTRFRSRSAMSIRKRSHTPLAYDSNQVSREVTNITLWLCVASKKLEHTSLSLESALAEIPPARSIRSTLEPGSSLHKASDNLALPAPNSMKVGASTSCLGWPFPKSLKARIFSTMDDCCISCLKSDLVCPGFRDFCCDLCNQAPFSWSDPQRGLGKLK